MPFNETAQARALLCSLDVCLQEFHEQSICERCSAEAVLIMRLLRGLHVDILIADKAQDEPRMALSAQRLNFLCGKAKELAERYMTDHKEQA